MSTPLHHLAFSSQVLIEFTDAQLILQAERSYAHSQLHEVTGVLLYHAGHFLAIFEGPADVIDAVRQSVADDARPHNIQMLARGPIAQRSFSDWHMSFLLSHPEKAEAPSAGYRSLLDPALLCLRAGASPHLLDMLSEFVAAVLVEARSCPAGFRA